MKIHKLNNRAIYPTHHVWRTNQNKINVYSSADINKGDKIELNGKTATVTEVKMQNANEGYADEKTNFYELDLRP